MVYILWTDFILTHLDTIDLLRQLQVLLKVYSGNNIVIRQRGVRVDAVRHRVVK